MSVTSRSKRVLSVVFAASFIVGSTAGYGADMPSKAAGISLNKTSLSLTVGKSATLKVKGTTAKVIWKSSDKTVATVSSKGKVVAKKEGKATVTAKVQKKSLKCKVTVKGVTPLTQTGRQILQLQRVSESM